MPVQEIVIAVDPDEVPLLSEAMELKYEITCTLHSGRPAPRSAPAADRSADGLSQVFAVLTKAVLSPETLAVWGKAAAASGRAKTVDHPTSETPAKDPAAKDITPGLDPMAAYRSHGGHDWKPTAIHALHRTGQQSRGGGAGRRVGQGRAGEGSKQWRVMNWTLDRRFKVPLSLRERVGVRGIGQVALPRVPRFLYRPSPPPLSQRERESAVMKLHRGRPADRAGYALVLFVMIFFGLMGLAALVIDLGFARLAQRQMQTAADSRRWKGCDGETSRRTDTGGSRPATWLPACSPTTWTAGERCSMAPDPW